LEAKLTKKKYEQPLLVRLNFIDVGYGRCKAGSNDADRCKTGFIASNKCKAGGAKLANKCKAGILVK